MRKGGQPPTLLSLNNRMGAVMHMPALFERGAACLLRIFGPRMRWRTQLAGAFASGALMSVAILVLSSGGVWATSKASHLQTHAVAPLQARTSSSSLLDRLRGEAAAGDLLSLRELSNALLDRYDAAGDPQDLFEAMVWVDRQWELSGGTDAAPRIVARYCDQRVMRWHWLCISGE